MFVMKASQITEDMLASFPYWKFVFSKDGKLFANVMPSSYLSLTDTFNAFAIKDNYGLTYYDGDTICYPVDLMNDGSEYRYFIPALPGEIPFDPQAEQYIANGNGPFPSGYIDFYIGSNGPITSAILKPPTPESWVRETHNGFVWTTKSCAPRYINK